MGNTFFLENLTANTIENQEFTLGYVFKKGEVLANQTVTSRIGGVDLPVQIDKKATYRDGSLRHCAISGVTPSIAANSELTVDLATVDGTADNNPLSLARAASAGLNGTVEITLNAESGGGTYRVNILDLIKRNKIQHALAGPECTEWLVKESVRNVTSNTAHAHLIANFQIRLYKRTGNTRISFCLENTTCLVPNPKTQTYNLTLTSGLKTKTFNNIPHFNKTRYRVVMWLGEEPSVHIKYDPAQLMATGAVPNYDPALTGNIHQSLIDKCDVFDDSVVSRVDKSGYEWDVYKYGPMGNGFMQKYMPQQGGRPDIGLLPDYAAGWILSQNPIMKNAVLKIGDISGSWGVHFRDDETGLPVSVKTRPRHSLVWGDAFERSDRTVKSGNSPYTPDAAHQPSMAFLPYLISCDHYYLEQLHFYNSYNLLRINNALRGFGKGYLDGHPQVRAKGWCMRELGRCAAFTPDDHPHKTDYNEFLQNNIEYYKEKYIPSSGEYNDYGAFRHADSDGKISPWMDDFVTASFNVIRDLDFPEIQPLLDWKARFPVKRMGYNNSENSTVCFRFAAAYQLYTAPKDTPRNEMFGTFDEVYEYTKTVPNFTLKDAGLVCDSAEMSTALGQQQGDIGNYPDGPEGFAANMQPALAASVDNNIPNAQAAWDLFENRTTKPNYTLNPVWAIVPRG